MRRGGGRSVCIYIFGMLEQRTKEKRKRSNKNTKYEYRMKNELFLFAAYYEEASDKRVSSQRVAPQ
jgi:hypothetical protein